MEYNFQKKSMKFGKNLINKLFKLKMIFKI